jgi:beta-ribofuranosylaminobenzene 5'-phosphate synthase
MRAIEEKLGLRLSPIQRILLTTDGSVTRVLEAIGREPVNVETIEQRVIQADEALAEVLGASPGEEVNYRVVNLTNSGGVLMRAVSYAPIARLIPEFRAPIMRRDMPIGRIMAELGIEARREITDINTASADRELAAVFGVPPGSVLLRRTYNIVHGGEVLLNITEMFPYAFFR